MSKIKLIIFTDGASRGNPGESSYGFVIKNSDGLILHEQGERLGVATNNFAEYSGVLEAMRYCSKFLKKYDEIDFFMDSLLVAMQLSGKYKIKSPTLRELIVQIKELEVNFKTVTYSHVPRAQNQLADKLANLALDK